MPAINNYFAASHGNIWVQPEGPNTTPILLGCHSLGDVAQAGGAITQAYCRDEVVMTSQAAKGPVTFDISTFVPKVADYLEDNKECPMPIYLTQADCGNFGAFLNYQRAEVYQYARWTNEVESGLANTMPDGGAAPASMMTISYQAEDKAKVWPCEFTRQTSAEPEDFNDIWMWSETQCRGHCGAYIPGCNVGFAVSDAAGGTKATVYYTTNGGITWTAVAAQPFMVNAENISCVTGVWVDKDTLRVIVGCGVTAAGNAGRTAYCDNWAEAGAVWTTASLGAVNANFLVHSGSLFSLDYYHIWAGDDFGDIYFSEDGGATWTIQYDGVTANDIYSIKFRDEHYGLAVGLANFIIYTDDGGEHWTQITAPVAQAGVAARSCEILDAYNWWVGYADGDLYYTKDGGTTWAVRVYAAPTGWVTKDRVNDIVFTDDFNGWLAIGFTGAAAAKIGALVRTFNGGEAWEAFATPTMDVGGNGLNAVSVCDYNKAYGAGDQITTGVICVVAK